jgi:hypothetical protein
MPAEPPCISCEGPGKAGTQSAGSAAASGTPASIWDLIQSWFGLDDGSQVLSSAEVPALSGPSENNTVLAEGGALIALPLLAAMALRRRR